MLTRNEDVHHNLGFKVFRPFSKHSPRSSLFGTGSTTTSSKSLRRLLGTVCSSHFDANSQNNPALQQFCRTSWLLTLHKRAAFFQQTQKRTQARSTVEIRLQIYAFCLHSQDFCLLQRLKLNLRRVRFGPLVLYITRTACR